MVDGIPVTDPSIFFYQKDTIGDKSVTRVKNNRMRWDHPDMTIFLIGE